MSGRWVLTQMHALEASTQARIPLGTYTADVAVEKIGNEKMQGMTPPSTQQKKINTEPSSCVSLRNKQRGDATCKCSYLWQQPKSELGNMA